MKTKKKEKEFNLEFCMHLEKGKLYGILSNKPPLVDCCVPEFLLCFLELSFSRISNNQHKQFFSEGLPST